jgi:hypothetical protein
MESKPCHQSERRELVETRQRKTMRSCKNCQKSHQRCGKIPRSNELNRMLFHSIHYRGKILTWFLDNLLPCTRCIKRGMSHTCVEGIRKKPRFIQYLVKTPRPISSDYKLSDWVWRQVHKNRDVTTDEEHDSIVSQSKPAAGVSGPDRIVRDKSVLYCPEYSEVRGEDTKKQSSPASSRNIPAASDTQCPNWDARLQRCRSLSCYTHTSSELAARKMQYCEQASPTESIIHRRKTCEDTGPLFVHPGDFQMFPEQTVPRGFTISSGWANTFLYPN